MFSAPTKFSLAILFYVSCLTVLAANVMPQRSALAINLESVHDIFATSEQCIACHSNVVGPDGQDISIGYTWRASMMANSSRDPYWQAAVRREVMDHPAAQESIEDTCATCHMPMARFAANVTGEAGTVFAHLNGSDESQATVHALDGVSCTVCHQMSGDNFGDEESFDGGFVIDTSVTPGERQIFGPFDVDAGRQRVMKSAANFVPTESTHVQQSELCATCHTLFTNTLDTAGQPTGAVLPEQVPYLEWLHSDYKETKSCQDCHMPVVTEDAPITSVLGQAREAVSQHVFRGGNAFMLRILNRYRDELGVQALSEELEASALRTDVHLNSDTASLSVNASRASNARLSIEVAIEIQAGHKFPTAYPSRRAWLHVTVRGANNDVVFESGMMRADGSINGNAADDDPSQFEPHYTQIVKPDQVQIYESMLVDGSDRVTTGLLRGARYIKDNRLLPQGFDKAGASEDIATLGRASKDGNFRGGGDRIRYLVDTSASRGPWTVDVELLYQSISYRWAENLRSYNAREPQRFVGYYDENADQSAALIAEGSVQVN